MPWTLLSLERVRAFSTHHHEAAALAGAHVFADRAARTSHRGRKCGGHENALPAKNNDERIEIRIREIQNICKCTKNEDQFINVF
jgi:hypothetical protein